MSTRRARLALCTLAVSGAFSFAPLPDGAAAKAGPAAARPTGAPDLTLSSQTPWVTPAAPWFTLALGVHAANVPVRDLKVTVTFYGRIEDASQLQQDTGNVPDRDALGHVTLPVTATPLGRVAVTCVTVLPDSDATPPTASPTSTGACAPGGPTVVLGCTPDVGVCGDVYPVSVALQRAGSGNTLSRFTTFLTYQEPTGPGGSGNALRVSWIVPVGSPAATSLAVPSAADLHSAEQLTGELAANRSVTLTLAVNPRTAAALTAQGGRPGVNAVADLADLTTAPNVDQLLPQPYVPVNLASLTGAGLTGDIALQMARGSSVLRADGLHATPGPWVDQSSVVSGADASNLAGGLRAAASDTLVLPDGDLAPSESQQLTFAQPFTLSIGHSGHVSAAALDGVADSRFDADPADPTLEASQLLATLEFIHFENAFTEDPRGVVIMPPASWPASSAFVTTMLNGLADNPSLSTVTLSQYFAQVPQGGNNEPTARSLQSGPVPASQSVNAATANKLAVLRAHLTSFEHAVLGHPAALTALSDALLTTEDSAFTPAQRAAALAEFTAQLDGALSTVTLAAERTITFTSRTAAIPITVLSNAPYTVKVVLSIDSDKFTFPDGSTRHLTLNRPTTPVRIEARARTSGDRLPVEVTLRTPDGLLVIAQTQVTVHSTVISLVGIALTVLAGLTLLIWWGRTWRRGRRRRPRAH